MIRYNEQRAMKGIDLGQGRSKMPDGEWKCRQIGCPAPRRPTHVTGCVHCLHAALSTDHTTGRIANSTSLPKLPFPRSVHNNADIPIPYPIYRISHLNGTAIHLLLPISMLLMTRGLNSDLRVFVILFY